MRMGRMFVGILSLVAFACRSDPPKEDRENSVEPASAPRLASPESAPLDHFVDAEALRAYLERIAELREIRREHIAARWQSEHASSEDFWSGVEESVVTGSAPSPEAVLMSPTSVVAFDTLSSYTPNLELSDAESITHNQERGVDEGDIVKRIGEHLIVLRRGRLHSIEIGSRSGDPFHLADVADVFPYSIPHQAWYDEVLVDGRRILVLGYSYETESTELAIFDLDGLGRLLHRASHAIRSGDYYSWENYGSRLVDHRLVIYAPIDLSDLRREDASPWPVYATWSPDGLEARWTPLVEEIEIATPLQGDLPTTLHTVIECDLGASALECEARGVVGGEWAEHYVSPTAVHLWIEGPAATFDPMTINPAEYARGLAAGIDPLDHSPSPGEGDEAFVYRIPLDDSPIGAIEVVGSPFDQFSFRESDEALDLFLVRGSRGTTSTVAPSWWHVPLSAFERKDGDRRGVEIHPLPDLAAHWRCRRVQRFVADHLLYGNCLETTEGPTIRGVHAVELVSPPRIRFVRTPGRVDRIEPIGGDALVVADAGFTSLEPSGTHLLPILLATPSRSAPALFLDGYVELESRSHAFNWTPHASDDRLLGLPFSRLDRRGNEGPLAIDRSEPTSLIAYFLMDDLGHLVLAGDLAETVVPDPPPDDCTTSCIDWYGSVRPIFLEGRVLGLIGDELAEVRLGQGGIEEVQRMRMRGAR